MKFQGFLIKHIHTHQ